MDTHGNKINRNRIVTTIIVATIIVATIFTLLYVFVYRCKGSGDKCETNSDCCNYLKCIDGKCGNDNDNNDNNNYEYSTTTTSPQGIVEQIPSPSGVRIPSNEQNIPSSSGSCGTWFDSHGEYTIAGIINKDNVCQFYGKIPLSRETNGDSISNCCRDPTNCGELFDLYPSSSASIPDWVNRDIVCQYNGKYPLPDETLGNNIDTCCEIPVNCGEWFSTSIELDRDAETICASIDNPPRKYPRPDETQSVGQDACCYDACGEWFTSINGGSGDSVCNDAGKYPFPDDTEGYSLNECCRDMECQEWNNLGDSSCPTGKVYDVTKASNIAYHDNPGSYCCRDINCGEWNTSTSCTGGEIFDSTKSSMPGNSREECCMPMKCLEWINRNECPTGKVYDSREDETDAIDPENQCCRYMYCREWNDINPVSCPDNQVYDLNKSITSVEGSGPETVCCSDSCEKWFNESDGETLCLENTRIPIQNPEETPGNNIDGCCRYPETCGDRLSIDTGLCNFNEIFDENTITSPYTDFDCCKVKTCSNWFELATGEESSLCRFGRLYDTTKSSLVSGGGSDQGYGGKLLGPDECCRDVDCQEWNQTGMSMVYEGGTAVGMGEDGQITTSSCTRGTIYDPGTASIIVSGSSSTDSPPENKCCRDVTCGEWAASNSCPSGKKAVNNLNSISSNTADPTTVCCRNTNEYDNCLEWNNTNTCPYGKIYNTDVSGRPLEDVQIPSNICCRDVTCEEWVTSSPCPTDTEENPGVSNNIGYGSDYCCQTTINCGSFFDMTQRGDSICLDNDLIPRVRSTIGNNIGACCRDMLSCEDYSNLYSCTGNTNLFNVNTAADTVIFGGDADTSGGPTSESYFNSQCCTTEEWSCQDWFDLDIDPQTGQPPVCRQYGSSVRVPANADNFPTGSRGSWRSVRPEERMTGNMLLSENHIPAICCKAL
jgi:hypothetical protein